VTTGYIVYEHIYVDIVLYTAAYIKRVFRIVPTKWARICRTIESDLWTVISQIRQMQKKQKKEFIMSNY